MPAPILRSIFSPRMAMERNAKRTLPRTMMKFSPTIPGTLLERKAIRSDLVEE
jgi:hypothetical protein